MLNIENNRVNSKKLRSTFKKHKDLKVKIIKTVIQNKISERHLIQVKEEANKTLLAEHSIH
jgi:hypothetical protein